MRIRKRRAVVGLGIGLGLLVVALTLTSCSADVVKGTPFADNDQVESFQATRFDAAITALGSVLQKDNSLRGTVFKHATFGAMKEDSEWADYVLGTPPAIFVKSSSSRPGDNLDLYHPAGGTVDYLLLGSLYQKIEPTSWVSLPTEYGANPIDSCQLPGIQTVCDLEKTITYTKQAGGVPVVKQYLKNADGTASLLTAVTLASIVKDNSLLDLSPVEVSKLTPAMLKSLIPLRINLDRGGNLLQIQLDGTVAGATPFVVQVGFQVTGATQPSDFPPAPSVIDVTVIPDAAGAAAFYQAVARAAA